MKRYTLLRVNGKLNKVEYSKGEWVSYEEAKAEIQKLQRHVTPTPTLTKLEYFALIIGAHQDGIYRDLWADNAIERAKLLIAELDKAQAQEVMP